MRKLRLRNPCPRTCGWCFSQECLGYAAVIRIPKPLSAVQVCFLTHVVCLLSVLGDSAPCLIPTYGVFCYPRAFPQVVPFTWNPLPSSLSGKIYLFFKMQMKLHTFFFFLLIFQQLTSRRFMFIRILCYPIVYTSRSICTSLPSYLCESSNLCQQDTEIKLQKSWGILVPNAGVYVNKKMIRNRSAILWQTAKKIALQHNRHR